MYGPFKRDMEEKIDKIGCWNWLRKSTRMPEAEALIFAAQGQALRTKHVKFHIDKTSDSPLCRLCGEKGETISHIVSERKKLKQKEYKRGHDNVARIVHWELSGAFQIKSEEKRYEHKPGSVMENEDVKFL